MQLSYDYAKDRALTCLRANYESHPVWKNLKRRLAGRFFRSLDELKATITAILGREMGNRLKSYLVA